MQTKAMQAKEAILEKNHENITKNKPLPDRRQSGSDKHVTVDDNVFEGLDSSERVTKPKDKRLDKLRRRRSQYSSQSSQYSEGSFEGTSIYSETSKLFKCTIANFHKQPNNLLMFNP